MTETLIVMLSLPFALVGGLWLMWWLGFYLSVAVAVGVIAPTGVAVETGVIRQIYLDQTLEEPKARRARAIEPSLATTCAKRSRPARSNGAPQMMTMVAICGGCYRLSGERRGIGGGAAHRRAMIGGMVSTMTLIVIPTVHTLVKGSGPPCAAAQPPSAGLRLGGRLSA